MFIAIVVLTIFLTWKYGDWRNWQKYQSTMLLFPLGNLFYNFVYHDHFLWKFNPDAFNCHVMEIIYSFTVFPLTVLLFLSYFPSDIKRQLLRISKYIAIYIAGEYFLLKMNRIEYNSGWNIWWSLAWDCMMFPTFAIHYKKPLLAYIFIIGLIFFMNWLFPFRLN